MPPNDRGAAMEQAIIDVGSNSVRMVIYEVDARRHEVREIYDNKEMAGLAGFVDAEGALSEQGIQRAVDAVDKQLRRLSYFACDGVCAFATAAVRNAVNSAQVCERVERACGIRLDVLSGEDEATLSFRGACRGIPVSDGVMFDLGGGSMEVVRFERGIPVHSASLPVGSLNLYVTHVAAILPTSDEVRAIREDVAGRLKGTGWLEGMKSPVLVGVGGAVRAAAKLARRHFRRTGADGMLAVADLRGLLAATAQGGNGLAHEVLAVEPSRVHTVFPGMAAVDALAQSVAAERIVVARQGVREGYLFQRVLGWN